MHYSFYLITKVPEFGSQPESVLQPEDDPHGWCPRVQKDWVIANRLQVGKKNNLGVLTQCSPLLLTQGDFVDVAVEIDVASDGTSSQNSTVRVHLSLLHIVLLAKASKFPRVRSSPPIAVRHVNEILRVKTCQSGLLHRR